jgi:valyl-tRNA synthetase
LAYQQKIDVSAERERLTKEQKKLETQLANTTRQLSNEQFLSKAPAAVVEGLRRQEGELRLLLEKNKRSLASLS